MADKIEIEKRAMGIRKTKCVTESCGGLDTMKTNPVSDFSKLIN